MKYLVLREIMFSDFEEPEMGNDIELTVVSTCNTEEEVKKVIKKDALDNLKEAWEDDEEFNEGYYEELKDTLEKDLKEKLACIKNLENLKINSLCCHCFETENIDPDPENLSMIVMYSILRVA